MKIYSTLQIGSFHSNHCEDFQISKELGNHKWLIAVMDGCTMGEESVFASGLIGKILKKVAKKQLYQQFRTPGTTDLKSELKEILREVFAELKLIKNQLGLETNELLSTILLGVIDEKKMDAEFIVIGDGLICADGNYTEYEQGDKPDYLAYHLSENFEEWFNKQEQVLSMSAFSDLSICTDGIYTFKNFKNPREEKAEEIIKEFLLKDKEGSENPNFLDTKIQILKDEWNHYPGDDLAIIRIIRF